MEILIICILAALIIVLNILISMLFSIIKRSQQQYTTNIEIAERMARIQEREELMVKLAPRLKRLM